MMALEDHARQSQGSGDDNSLGTSHPGPGDLPESKPEVVSSLVIPTPGFVACSTSNYKRWDGYIKAT